MLFDIVVVFLGFAFVAKGGDLFVDSSVNIGRVLRVPRIVIGGTLVSLATTIPELFVSVRASLAGDTGMALGNAVGSCICNIGLVVGTVAMIMPISVDRVEFMKRSLWMLTGCVLVIVFSWDLSLDMRHGVLLLVFAFAYLFWDAFGMASRRKLTAGGDADVFDDSDGLLVTLGWFLLGASLVAIGSELLVRSGKNLAEALGVSSTIIGFSVIAVGTSLPELVTGISSARKGVPDLSLGNIVGANVLNLFLIVGASTSISPLVLEPSIQRYAFPWLILFFVTLVGVVMKTGSVRRAAGMGLLTMFVLYAIGLFALPS